MTTNDENENEDENINKTNIAVFKKKTPPTTKTLLEDVADETPISEYVEAGLAKLQEDLKQPVNGFIAIVFDEKNRASSIWTGEADLASWLGAIELFKDDFKQSFYALS